MIDQDRMAEYFQGRTEFKIQTKMSAIRSRSNIPDHCVNAWIPCSSLTARNPDP